MLIPINSPCTGECTLDESYMVCKSCYRTLDEIADWPYMSWQERDECRAQFAGRKIILEGDK